MNERKQIYLATTLRIILSIILVILGVLSLVFLHGYRFSYTIYVPVLLGLNMKLRMILLKRSQIMN